MPEGFEKQVPPEGLADLLQFLAQKGKYLPLDLRKVATATTTKGMFSESGPGSRAPGLRGLGPEDRRGRAVRAGRPAGRPAPERRHAPRPHRDDPAEDAEVGEPARQRDGQGDPPPQRGERSWVTRRAARGRVSMIVRIHYEDGSTEDHELKNGVAVRRRQRREGRPGLEARLQARRAAGPLPDRRARKKQTIASIELVKGSDRSAPIVLAATVEGFE